MFYLFILNVNMKKYIKVNKKPILYPVALKKKWHRVTSSS